MSDAWNDWWAAHRLEFYLYPYICLGIGVALLVIWAKRNK